VRGTRPCLRTSSAVATAPLYRRVSPVESLDDLLRAGGAAAPPFDRRSSSTRSSLGADASEGRLRAAGATTDHRRPVGRLGVELPLSTRRTTNPWTSALQAARRGSPRSIVPGSRTRASRGRSPTCANEIRVAFLGFAPYAYDANLLDIAGRSARAPGAQARGDRRRDHPRWRRGRRAAAHAPITLLGGLPRPDRTATSGPGLPSASKSSSTSPFVSLLWVSSRPERQRAAGFLVGDKPEARWRCGEVAGRVPMRVSRGPDRVD